MCNQISNTKAATEAIQSTELLAVTYQVKEQFDNKKIDPVTFHRMNSPFYAGEKWAVRYLSYCLSKDGEWEHEPLPSSRDEKFYKRFRFDTIEEAVKAFQSFG